MFFLEALKKFGNKESSVLDSVEDLKFGFAGKLKEKYFSLRAQTLERGGKQVRLKKLFKGVPYFTEEQEKKYFQENLRKIFYVGDFNIAFEYFLNRNKGHLNTYDINQRLKLLRTSTNAFVSKLFDIFESRFTQNKTLSDDEKSLFLTTIQKMGYCLTHEKQPIKNPFDFYKNIYFQIFALRNFIVQNYQSE
jgi:Zn-dependent metalloprotease